MERFSATVPPPHGRNGTKDDKVTEKTLVENETHYAEAVIDNAKPMDFTSEGADSERLQKWLESLDPDELGKYKM